MYGETSSRHNETQPVTYISGAYNTYSENIHDLKVCEYEHVGPKSLKPRERELARYDEIRRKAKMLAFKAKMLAFPPPSFIVILTLLSLSLLLRGGHML